MNTNVARIILDRFCGQDVLITNSQAILSHMGRTRSQSLAYGPAVSAMYYGLQHAVTVTSLAQGTSWAVAITQAFFSRCFKPLLATS